MSFLYPRTVSIKRPPAQPDSAVGDQGEAPDSVRANETTVAAGLPASIQQKGKSTHNPVGLPADADQALWNILIPKNAAALGLIQENDIVVDDLGDRYQVIAAYWNSLGYQLRAVKVQV